MKDTQISHPAQKRASVQPSKAGHRSPGQTLVSASMSEEMLAQLDELARAHDRTRSDMIRQLIKAAAGKPPA